MECPLCKVQYVRKAEAAFNIKLNNCRKDVSNPKSTPADLHFRKPGDSFSLHPKFTLIEQLSNHTTDKDILKFRLKYREHFWIQKFEKLTLKVLNQELNNVQIPDNYISCSLFSIFNCSFEIKSVYYIM